jgi:hypothetical protein
VNGSLSTVDTFKTIFRLPFYSSLPKAERFFLGAAKLNDLDRLCAEISEVVRWARPTKSLLSKA